MLDEQSFITSLQKGGLGYTEGDEPIASTNLCYPEKKMKQNYKVPWAQSFTGIRAGWNQEGSQRILKAQCSMYGQGAKTHIQS